jgi:hypothetical protein
VNLIQINLQQDVLEMNLETLILKHGKRGMPSTKLGLRGQLQVETRTSKLNRQLCVGCSNVNWLPFKEVKRRETVLGSTKKHNIGLAKVDHGLTVLT